jgi:hypothetical protein
VYKGLILPTKKGQTIFLYSVKIFCFLQIPTEFSNYFFYEKFTEKNYRNVASLQHQKICAEFFSVLQDFSLLMLMVGLSRGGFSQQLK